MCHMCVVPRRISVRGAKPANAACLSHKENPPKVDKYDCEAHRTKCCDTADRSMSVVPLRFSPTRSCVNYEHRV